MGYHWKIINLDKKQRIDVGKFGKEITYLGRKLIGHMQERRWRPMKEILQSEMISFKNKRIPNLGRLSLPVELLDMIFSHLTDAVDAFYLGCANTQLLLIGEKRIHQVMKAPSWKGDRLMCVNESSTGEDLPEGLVLDDDYSWFCTAVRRRSFVWAEYEMNISDWAVCKFRPPVDDRWFGGYEQGLLRDHRRLLDPEPSIALAVGQPVSHTKVADVLWNLSKKEYVLSRSIPRKLTGAAKKFSREDVMGTALVFMICWATDECSASLGYMYEDEEPSINRGRWAGDRFEVSGDDVLDLRTKEEGSTWKDVSQEIFNFWSEIFEIDL